MVALFALVLALICGIACAVPVEPEALPTVLQQPAYAEPVLEPEPVPFQEEMDIGCGDVCVDCGPLVAQESFWYAGVDLLATQFNHAVASFYYYSYDEYAVALRPYLGWEGSSGVGIRGRWWFTRVEGAGRYSHSMNLLPNPFDVEVTAANIDIDFYRRFCFERTNCLLGVGTKVISIAHSHNFNYYGEDEIVTGGISVFAEGNHTLYRGSRTECAFVGYGRIGLLTGKTEGSSFRPDGFDEDDTNMSVTELGLGLEIQRKFRRGDFIFQIVSEVQRWETNLTSDLAFDAVGLRFGGQW